MHRRKFLSFLGGGAAWPLAAGAQQGEPARRLGVLMSIREDDPLRQSYADALESGLRVAGWIDGKTISLDYRWAGADVGRIKQAAKELVAARPNVLIAHTSPATIALMNETSATPILFVTVTEPLAQGLVKSLARPGGNVTGFSNFEFSMGGKWLQILKEILPDVKRASVLFNPDTAPGAGDIFLRSIEADAKAHSVEVIAAPVRSVPDIEAIFGSISHSQGTGAIIPPDIFLVVNRANIIELAARYRVPTIYQYDYFARNGGLVSYGVDVPDLFRRAAGYVDRVLNGALPADLPVQAPTKFQLVVNLKTAKELGLSVPPTLLTRADEVIE
jgi:putative tryptophan/tyrosine transport system substrate-binding protein